MFSIISIIKTTGYLGIFGIIFAESGLFVGFFLPGDSLLFTAGFLASQNFLNIWILVIGSFLAAVIGDSVGYAFGKKIGPKIFTKKDSLFFHQQNVEQAKIYFDQYGKKTLIMARFIPVVRTFVPILAGVGQMSYKTFLTYNILGGLLWTTGLTLLGYYLGRKIPNIDNYILPIVAIIIVGSLLPTAYHFIKDERYRRKIADMLKKYFKQH